MSLWSECKSRSQGNWSRRPVLNTVDVRCTNTAQYCNYIQLYKCESEYRAGHTCLEENIYKSVSLPRGGAQDVQTFAYSAINPGELPGWETLTPPCVRGQPSHPLKTLAASHTHRLTFTNHSHLQWQTKLN